MSVSSNSQFVKTYHIYREYVNFTKDLSYRQWMRLPEQYKAAALYVQFYKEITLAWYKVKTNWSLEEEGVETINQYLIKNVEKIKADKKRFNPKYIYRVAYNCLYCLCIDPSKNKDRYYNEASETFSCGDDSLDWFDFLGNSEDPDFDRYKDALAIFVSNLDGKYQVYLEHSLGEISDCEAFKRYRSFKLAEGSIRDKELVSKTLKEVSAILKDELQKLFVSKGIGFYQA